MSSASAPVKRAKTHCRERPSVAFPAVDRAVGNALCGVPPLRGVPAMISTRSLIQLCHRVGTAVKSGVDARRVWEMEERHASGALRTALGTIRQQVASGGTVAEGMHAADGYFPPMFVQLVAIGEHTGQLDQVLHRLGEH